MLLPRLPVLSLCLFSTTLFKSLSHFLSKEIDPYFQQWSFLKWSFFFFLYFFFVVKFVKNLWLSLLLSRPMYLSLPPPSIYLSIFLCLSVSVHLSASLSFYIFILLYLPVHLYICLSLYLCTVLYYILILYIIFKKQMIDCSCMQGRNWFQKVRGGQWDGWWALFMG